MKTRTRTPPKTSSERGRKFRAKQREREAELVRCVAELRDHVQALERSRQLRFESLLRVRHVHGGSLQRTIREYFTLFQDGLEALDEDGLAERPHMAAQIRFKESYLHYVYDSDATMGGLRGVGAIIDQWQRYTELHSNFHLAIGRIDVVGEAVDPTFHLHMKLSVRISTRTLRCIFPAVLQDEALMGTFLHKTVTYDCRATLRFTDDGRICEHGLEVGFVDGLVRAGGSPAQVARMMQHSNISPRSMLVDGAATRSEGAMDMESLYRRPADDEPRPQFYSHEWNPADKHGHSHRIAT